METVNSELIRAERLAELGIKLKEMRHEKAISLEQIAAQTMINIRLLTAIEEGQLNQLPEPIYTQGFIRRYADSLGLNGAEFAKAYPTTAIISTSKGRDWQRLNLPIGQFQLRPIHLYVLYVILILLAVNGLSYWVNRPGQNVSGVSPSSPLPNLTPPSPSPSPALTSKPAIPSPSPTGSSQPVNINVSTTQNSWMSVIADGKEVYAGILPRGTKKVWTAQKQLTLRTGNAGGVMVSQNGSEAKPMGRSGAIEQRIFTPITPSSTVPPTP